MFRLAVLAREVESRSDGRLRVRLLRESEPAVLPIGIFMPRYGSGGLLYVLRWLLRTIRRMGRLRAQVRMPILKPEKDQTRLPIPQEVIKWLPIIKA
ncbi:MAG: hypothetical protein RMK32_00615 [Anaerolineae bacterium]|nr:hypothetical protein [Thermoflexus sp.]MDW8064117.1 hypothetical protein [Anaerolineae bacterium]